MYAPYFIQYKILYLFTIVKYIGIQIFQQHLWLILLEAWWWPVNRSKHVACIFQYIFVVLTYSLWIYCIITMPEFCCNLPIFIFMQYAICIIYIHGNGSIFHVFNNILQEVSLPTFPITSLKQYAINTCTYLFIHTMGMAHFSSTPYLKCESKFANYILLKIFTLVLPLRNCIT